MKKLSALLFSLMSVIIAFGSDYKTISNISYINENDSNKYKQERCKLDIYHPVDSGYPTLIWFHGGGLTGGNKHFPAEIMNQGIAIVAVNYRLSPKAQNPDYINDAAKAVAWVYNNIEKYGGDKSKIFVSGHSAGGYLSLMLATDKKYLSQFGVNADSIAAYLPVSGQTVTHFTIRKERNLPDGLPIIDEFAPVNKTRKNTPPIILYTGDRYMEIANRWEENALFESVSRNIGNKKVKLYELQGCDHGTVLEPAYTMIRRYIIERNKKK